MRVIFVTALIISACSVKNNINYSDNNKRQELDTLNIRAIEKALNVSDFRQYLHLENPDRRVILFYSHYPLKPNDVKSFRVFSNIINIINQNELNIDNKNVIRLISATQLEKSLNLKFDYKIEGIILDVLLNKKGKEYEILSYKIVEN